MRDFSIIIPCYNAALTLQATLQSIQAQTCQDWEVICVDDGSTDATLEVLHTARSLDPRIRVIHNVGKGPSRARNLGALTFATGDVIAFCDADDIWGPEKLGQLNDCFDTPDIDAAFGQVAFFQDDPAEVTATSTIPATPLSIQMLLGENPVCTMSNIAVRRDAFLRTGGFNEEMVHNEDLDWLIRLVGTGAQVVGIDALQTWYRSSPYGLSANLRAMQQGRKDAIRTAGRFGHAPTRRSDAIFLRYLCRRALRLGQGRLLPLRLAFKGVMRSPAGFFSTPWRGLATLAGAMLVPVLPSRLSQILFSR